MRRYVVAAIILTLGTIGLAVASSAPTTSCTKTGTPQGEPIAGTGHRDVICARGGNDYVAGLDGPDLLKGDGGNDTMVGGNGLDRLLGAAGRDKLFTVDGRAGDVSIGGAGADKCFADRGDIVRGCERVFRGAKLAVAKALSAAFGGQGSLAEELISVVPTITIVGPPGPVGSTGPPGPPGPGFPPCTPHPNIPPDSIC